MSELLISMDGPIERWTLNRPDRRNAIGRVLMAEIIEAAERTRAGGCRLVVLDATPPAFCAGSDLKEMAAASRDAIVAHESRWSVLRDALRSLHCPVLAVIRGAAMGGGLFLAVFADQRIAAREALFAAPEVPLGWLPPGGFEELIDLVGLARARDLVMTGRRIDGGRAYEIGLVESVVPLAELDTAVAELEHTLIRLPEGAVADLKDYLRERPRCSPRGRDRAQLDRFVTALERDDARATLRRYGAPTDTTPSDA